MGRKLTVFALFYFVFEGKFQVQASRGAYIRRGNLTEDFLGLIFGGAYKWNGLFSEFYGIGLSITRQTSDANDFVKSPLFYPGYQRFFSRVRRGASLCRLQADTCSAEGRTDTSGNRA